MLEITYNVREFKSDTDIWLYFAPVKSAALDNIITKAVEMGVAVLQPVITKNTVVGRVNVERMTANAIEAAEQCERITVPVVNEPVSFTEAINSLNERKLIYGDESGVSEPAGSVIKNLPKGKYAILIGPEGGFAPEELEKLKNNPNCIGITLGPRILKADTAAIVALSVFMSELGDWDEKPCFRG